MTNTLVTANRWRWLALVAVLAAEIMDLVGFVAASALCGLATSPGVLIGFRIAQGLLGAMLIPQGFGILKATFPPDDLGKAFGAFGPTIGLAVVGAPILGARSSRGTSRVSAGARSS
jgi:MFS family permease